MFLNIFLKLRSPKSCFTVLFLWRAVITNQKVVRNSWDFLSPESWGRGRNCSPASRFPVPFLELFILFYFILQSLLSSAVLCVCVCFSFLYFTSRIFLSFFCFCLQGMIMKGLTFGCKIITMLVDLILIRYLLPLGPIFQHSTLAKGSLLKIFLNISFWDCHEVHHHIPREIQKYTRRPYYQEGLLPGSSLSPSGCYLLQNIRVVGSINLLPLLGQLPHPYQVRKEN